MVSQISANSIFIAKLSYLDYQCSSALHKLQKFLRKFQFRSNSRFQVRVTGSAQKASYRIVQRRCMPKFIRIAVEMGPITLWKKKRTESAAKTPPAVLRTQY